MSSFRWLVSREEKLRDEKRTRRGPRKSEEDGECKEPRTTRLLLSSLLALPVPVFLFSFPSPDPKRAPLFETLDILIPADRPASSPAEATFAREYRSRSKDSPEIQNIDDTWRRIICKELRGGGGGRGGG